MGRLAKQPDWGILVYAPVDRVREILSAGKDAMLYRTNEGWIAGFCMDGLKADLTGHEAAQLLVDHGHIPVFRFDFSKYGFSTWHWDGEDWDLLLKEELPPDTQEIDETMTIDPSVILHDVGIRPPYEDPDVNPLPIAPIKPLRPREAIVIEGMSALGMARRSLPTSKATLTRQKSSRSWGSPAHSSISIRASAATDLDVGASAQTDDWRIIVCTFGSKVRVRRH